MTKLRSQGWFGKQGKDGFIYRAWMKNQGIPDDEFRDKPVIGICNTWSELTPCNGHFRELAESVKKGVLQAGGFPLEFPVMSLGETLIKPTAMLYRNLMSMDVEESIKTMLAYPGAYLLHVKVEKEENIFPMVPTGYAVTEIVLE